MLDPKKQTYGQQYASIYYARLDKLKPVVLKAAEAKWANAKGPSV